MGTRADFYVGRGKQAEWLGSIAWDGYPGGIDRDVLVAKNERVWREAVASFLKRDDATLPQNGWPWPWNDSRTTDYSYAFDEGRVWGTCFGQGWWPADLQKPEESDDDEIEVDFPDMTERKRTALGKKSGLIIFGV